jgi:hypothetical protein
LPPHSKGIIARAKAAGFARNLHRLLAYGAA